MIGSAQGCFCFQFPLLEDELNKANCVMQLKHFPDFGAVTLVEVECVDLLSVDEMRFFWISWFDYVIRFGRGQQQGSDQIAEYGEPLPTISAVSLYGYDTPITYEVRNFEGKGVFTDCE